MRLVFTVYALLCPSLAFGQGQQVPIPVTQGPTGAPKAGARITVCNSPATGGLPCTNLASIFSDVALTQPINQSTTPLSTDGLGNCCVIGAAPVTVYGAPGLYAYTVSGVGITAPQGPYNVTAPCVVGTSCLANPSNVLITANAGIASAGPNTLNVGQNIYAGFQFNNRILVDGCISTVTSPKYANTSAGINAAINAAIGLGGGSVDASACNTLSTYNTEIDVGNTSGVPVILFLPAGNSGGTPSWIANITDGVSCGLKGFNNSSVIGWGPGLGAPFQIAAGASANMAAVVCNDTSVANAHIRMEGFTASVYSGSPTITKAIGYFSGLGDNSLVQNMTLDTLSATATLSKVLWVNNSCCKTVLNNVNADASGISGVTPCFFGNGTTGPNLTITFHGSCVHPGNGASNLVDQEWNQDGTNTFTAYMEVGTSMDTTTPKVSIQAFGTPTAADIFTAMNAAGDIAASTRYMFDIASGAHAIIIGAQQGTVSTNAVNDHNSYGGVAATPVTAPVNTTFSYTTEKDYRAGGLLLGAQGTLTLKSGSGGGTYTGTNTSFASVDTTNLCTTITVPTGWKLLVTASGILESVTAAVTQSLALVDAGTTCAGGGITPLTGTRRDITPPAIATFDAPFTIQYIFAGDGAAHSISLAAATSNAADAWGIQNASAAASPNMNFQLMPSN